MPAPGLYLETSGEGPVPLLLLHGLFGSGRNWKSVGARLHSGFTVYRVDLRNHGSSFHHPVMDYPAMTTDLIALLDERELNSVCVLGHSMGGKVAMWLALNFPHRVRSLVVVDIAPVAYGHDFAPIVHALRSLPLQRIRNRAHAEQFLEGRVDPQGLRRFLLQNLVTDGNGYRWRINLDYIENALPTVLSFPANFPMQYSGPVLFAGGRESSYLLPEYAGEIHTRFPHARLEWIDHAGHWPQVDQPDEFLALVNGFSVGVFGNIGD